MKTLRPSYSFRTAPEGLLGIELDDELLLELEVDVLSCGKSNNLGEVICCIVLKPLEGQFKHYYELAEKQEGITGANLLTLLERRLDNVVYRMGMAASRKEARQLVLHAHFTLNGKKVTIPSLLVKAGDVIAVKETSKESVKIKALCDGLATAVTPKWLENDAANHLTKVVTLPAREDIDFEFEEQLIVELYSK